MEEEEEEVQELSPSAANKSKPSSPRGKNSNTTRVVKKSTRSTRSAPPKSSASKASQPGDSSKLAKSRGPGKTARVWRYFRNEHDEAGRCDYTYCELYLNKTLPSGEVEKVKCSYKNKGRNTSNMRYHLNSVHKAEAKILEDEEAKESTTAAAAGASSASFQPKVYDFFGNQAEEMIKQKRKRNPYPENALIYQRLKANLTRLAACTSFPLMMVGASEFVTTIYDLDQRAGDSLPSRNTLKKWVINYSEKVQHNLVGTLKRIRNFFVTIDIWSSPGLDKFFLGVIVRFH